MHPISTTAVVVFLVTLVATFVASRLGGIHAKKFANDALAGRGLNRWLLGLSAGATANSGFVVTAAVGLGYTAGMQWVMLPISWLLGDLLFWRLFPSRINEFGRTTGAGTVSQVLTAGLQGPLATAIGAAGALIVVTCLIGYTSAQWLAGQKFLAGVFGIDSQVALAVFAVLIVTYTALGGFRGSVYADTLQAVIRIVATCIAMIGVTVAARQDTRVFLQNIADAGPAFLAPFPDGNILYGVCFVIGFGAAAVGFGLGQPQMLTRYLAGKSPEETQSAKWIYIFFVQFTWIAMTVFGMILRGVMPGIADPETGLSVFFHDRFGAVITGVIAADIFATIGATTNSQIVAISQAVKHDLLAPLFPTTLSRVPLWLVSLGVGVVSMLVAAFTSGTVVSLAISSVSIMGAALAPAVLLKVMKWRHTAVSIATSIVVGLATALVWRALGANGVLNESIIGIACGLLANAAVVLCCRCHTVTES